MKKILIFLVSVLCTITLRGQDLKLTHSYIDAPPISVGDTITIKYELLEDNGSGATPNFLQYDFQWNNKLLEKISHTFDPFNHLTGENSNATFWTGYKFNNDDNSSVSELSSQYSWWSSGSSQAGENSYPQNSDWSVGRVTIQHSSTINLGDAHLYVKFRVKDYQGTTYTNYNHITDLNWARSTDQSTSTSYGVTAGDQNISLNEVGGVSAGNVTIKLKTNAIIEQNISGYDFGYTVYNKSDYENAMSNNEMQNLTPVSSGQLDSQGEMVLDMLENGVEYMAFFHPISNPQWLDDVVTVTDVYKIFQYSIDSDINGGGGSWEYHIQDILGEVTNDQTVDFTDSYELLAHINGVTTSSNVTSVENGAFNLSGLATTLGGISTDGHIIIDPSFKPTNDNKTFEFGHQLRGDVDFSHSFTPTSNTSVVSTQATTSRQMMARTVISNRTVESSPIEIYSRLENGKVILDMNISKEDLAGAQVVVRFDQNILEFDEAIFDTGNEMTNFATQRGDKLYIGSLDFQNGTSLKTGTPYKLIFKPKQTITNTIGLVSFRIVEGVKTDGTKVKFNIQ